MNKWWRQAVGYQIYPKSFLDSNHDGIGDVNGIRSKIDYLSELGIDFVWLCPIYQSPGVDNGYDISDYQMVDEQYGNMNEVTKMIDEFHNHGIKVMMDLVLNHTSTQHKWFLQAKQNIKSEFHDYYIWKKSNKNELPNNWTSLFGGTAWEYNKETDEYYYHLYAKQQADLNWENPKLRSEMYEIIHFWADKGIDGFRLDAITHLKKLQSFTDVNNPDESSRNIPGINKFLISLKKVYDKYNLVTVGEVGAVKPEEGAKWVNPINGFMDMLFQFDHVNFGDESKFNFETKSVPYIKEKLDQWQEAVDKENGILGLFIENHDLPRSVSYFGNEEPEERTASAKATGLMYFMMKGIPFIYQGQELGMINDHPHSIEEVDDVDSKRFYYEQLEKGENTQISLQKVAFKGRDNARTPMQWDNSKNAGFSDTNPWIKVSDSYSTLNVNSEINDPNSVFNFYKQMIHIRKINPELIYGKFKAEDPTSKSVIAYRRTGDDKEFLIITNLNNNSTEFTIPSDLKNKNYNILLNNNRANPCTNDKSIINLSAWGALLIEFNNTEERHNEI